MIHKNIYSKRINEIEEYDPYEYEIDDEYMMNSLMMLFSKFKEKSFISESLIDFCETKRIYISNMIEYVILKDYTYTTEAIINDMYILLNEYSTEDILDFIDITIAVINNKIEFYKTQMEKYNKKNDYYEMLIMKVHYIKELNEVFIHNNLGFTVIDDIVVTKESDYLHQEIIVKPLTLLINENFSGPLEEFKKAIINYTNKDYESTIIEACKSFESTMKSVLDKQGVVYKKDKATASTLLSLLKENGIFNPFLENMFTNLSAILASGLPAIRNKKSGHGDGIITDEVERSYASFALNLSGSSIVFLLDRYYETTK